MASLAWFNIGANWNWGLFFSGWTIGIIFWFVAYFMGRAFALFQSFTR